MKKSLYIQLLIHMGRKFNQKVTWTMILTDNITITNNTFTLQSTMHNVHRDLVIREEVIQKPRGNILTEDFRITVSTNVENRHEPQCKNQTNEPMKTSLWVLVIPMPP